MDNIIFGITGTHGAGKGTSVDFFASRRFRHCSCREFLWSAVDSRGLPRNRTSLNIVANELREKFGAEYVAFSVYLQARQVGGNAIVESIYTVGEIQKIRADAQLAGDRFILVAVDADQKLRYDRIMARKSETDRITFEEFQAQEARELANEDPSKHNLVACAKLADKSFPNNGTVEELHAALEALLDELMAGASA